MGAVLVLLGSAAAYFSLRGPQDVERAVAGSPTAAASQPGQESLPSGHPSIELPKEVLDFLDGLTAEADADPTSVEAAQKLVRARYRASVINASYRVSAEQALNRLMKLDPDNVEGQRISANLAYDSGNFAEAEKRFQAFLKLHPEDAAALTDLGSSLLFQDKVDEAIAAYQSATTKDPEFMQPHFNLGIAYQKQDRTPEAVAALRRALDLAGSPQERQHIENALAEVEGRKPAKIAGADAGTPPTAAAGPGDSPGGMPMPPPAPDRDVPTNADSDFQRQAEKPFITHPIVGPRVVAFEWSGPTTLKATIADFPMDRMPPFARDKFRSGMVDKLAAVASDNGVDAGVVVELVDKASGKTMDTLETAGGGAPSPAEPDSKDARE